MLHTREKFYLYIKYTEWGWAEGVVWWWYGFMGFGNIIWNECCVKGNLQNYLGT